MIEAHELTKRYGDTTAVHSLSFTIAPGTVTGSLHRDRVKRSSSLTKRLRSRPPAHGPEPRNNANSDMGET